MTRTEEAVAWTGPVGIRHGVPIDRWGNDFFDISLDPMQQFGVPPGWVVDDFGVGWERCGSYYFNGPNVDPLLKDQIRSDEGCRAWFIQSGGLLP